jgi:hypothetical protein
MGNKLQFRKGQLFHMTPIERLPAIVGDGRLLSDIALEGVAVPGNPIAHAHIKQRRRGLPVPVSPFGTVGEYVPFYLAPRSPMLYANHKGNVEGRTTGQAGIVYLVSTIDLVGELPGVVLANKHPARRPQYTTDLARFHDDTFIDWDVMFDPWFTSPTDTDRSERRQAEVLVHREVPLDALIGVAARSVEELAAARTVCEPDYPAWHFNDRPDWYF